MATSPAHELDATELAVLTARLKTWRPMNGNSARYAAILMPLVLQAASARHHNHVSYEGRLLTPTGLRLAGSLDNQYGELRQEFGMISGPNYKTLEEGFTAATPLATVEDAYRAWAEGVLQAILGATDSWYALMAKTWKF